MKRYAPDKPDSSLHRPGDTAYLRELLAAAGLSQRKAGPLLGMDERTMRYKVSGEKDLSYPEQYCLEVLADNASGAHTIHEESPEHEHTHKWYVSAVRPLNRADSGKFIIGLDAEGDVLAYGEVAADEFGAYILTFPGLGSRKIPSEGIVRYVLTCRPEDEGRSEIV